MFSIREHRGDSWMEQFDSQRTDVIFLIFDAL